MIRAQGLVVLGFVSALAWTVQGQSTARVAAATDAGLVLRTWRVKGIMACPDPCLWVENAYPVGILEVIRRPFESGIPELNLLLRRLRGSSSRTSSSHGSNEDGSGAAMQFAETRVLEAVPPLNLPAFAVPRSRGIRLSYVSELDRFGWRSAVADLVLHPGESVRSCDLPPRPKRICAGPWGNYYPRHGFVVRDSPVLAAFLQALRAARVASDPRGRIVLQRYPFEPRTGHWIQMIVPVRRTAVPIGTPRMAALERNALARDGRYLFVHFGIFEGCRKCLPTRLVGER